MSAKATIQNGVVVNLRPTSEASESDVSVHDYVRIGDTTNDVGVTFYRDGNIVVTPVPEEVPLWAFRAALVLGGITQAQVDALIESLPEPSRSVATIQWNYGNYIERGHALISQLGSDMGLTSDQIDDVFRTAASLK
jgi:hypothetical protein